MNRTWNLKLFVSISLGLHLLAFSIFSIFFPHSTTPSLSALNIEVSLLPPVKEERYKVRSSEFAPIESGQGVRSKEEIPLKIVEKKETEIKSKSTVFSNEEKKISQVERVEVTLPKKEQEPVSTSPVQSEVRIVSVSEPKPSPSNNEKIEMGSKKEEKVVLASLGNPVPVVNPPEKH